MSDPHEDLKQDLFFITTATSWCLCLVQILGIWTFGKLRGLLIIQKRYPRLVMLEAFISCFKLAVVYPLNMCYQNNYPEVSSKWWDLLCIGLTAYTVQITLIIENCRIWLISYDLHYLRSSQNHKWKSQIDASSAEKDWYLRNKGTWDSQQYVIRLGFVYYVMTSTVVFILNFFHPQLGIDISYAIGFGGFSFFFLSIIPIYLYVKTPRTLQYQFLFYFVEYKYLMLSTK